MPVVQVAVTSSIQEADEALRCFRARTGLRVRYCRRLRDGWVFFLSSEEEVDLVMSPGTRAALAEDDIVVGKVPQYRIESTVIASSLPADFLDMRDDDLATLIVQWNNVSVASVGVLCRGTIEIELDTPEDASLILHCPGGLMLGPNTFITRLERKRLVRVPQCGRCYSLEHDAYECTSPTCICFHCGYPGHAGNECDTDYVRCVNCEEDHVAFAYKCPIRQQKEEELRKRYLSLVTGASNGSSSHAEEDDDDREERAEREVSELMGMDRLFYGGSPQSQAGSPTTQEASPPYASLGIAPPRTPTPLSPGQATGMSPQRTPESLCSTSPHLGAVGGIPDPLPVSPRRSGDPERPPSRLDDPISPPVLRPQPSPHRSPMRGAGARSRVRVRPSVESPHVSPEAPSGVRSPYVSPGAPSAGVRSSRLSPLASAVIAPASVSPGASGSVTPYVSPGGSGRAAGASPRASPTASGVISTPVYPDDRRDPWALPPPLTDTKRRRLRAQRQEHSSPAAGTDIGSAETRECSVLPSEMEAGSLQPTDPLKKKLQCPKPRFQPQF